MKRTWKQMITLVLTAVFIIALFGSTPMQALDSGTTAFHDPFKTMFDSDVIIANELGIASANELLLPSLDDATKQMHQEQLLLLKKRLLDTYQYNRYIVKYTSDSSQSVSEILNGLSIQTKTISNSKESKSKTRGKQELLVLEEKINPSELANMLREANAGQEILYIQPDFAVSLASIEEELHILDRSDYKKSAESQVKQSVFKSPEAPPTTLVAVIDTGIDSEHEMIANYMITGWNFPNNNDQTYDLSDPLASAHGTHIAGVLAQTAEEADVYFQIVPLQVFQNGSAYTSDIIAAIDYAAGIGATVVNCSFSGTDENIALYETIESTDAFFVCAAGNHHQDLSEIPAYPANYRLPNVISVGSVNPDGGFSYFSSYSSDYVDIAVVGRDVISALPEGGTMRMTGTSISTATVAGTSALIRHLQGQMEPSELRDILLDSADQLDNLETYVDSGRRLNIVNALEGITGSSIVLNPLPADDFVSGLYQSPNNDGFLLSPPYLGSNIGAGDRHSVYAQPNGTVWDWGSNFNSQLGEPNTYGMAFSPKRVLGLSDIASVAVGDFHSLALKKDGSVWAWGWNQYGQMGDGTSTNNHIPQQINCLKNIIQVAAGYDFSMALQDDGTVYTWGRNHTIQPANGEIVFLTTPIIIDVLSGSGVSTIAAGGQHGLAVKNGEVWTWGNNYQGQLGDGTIAPWRALGMVNGLSGVVSVSGGLLYSLALKTDGTLFSWGHNNYGQLGDGTTIGRKTPVQMSVSGINQISAGVFHSLASDIDGTVWGWGYNGQGQLGDGTQVNKLIPTQVMDFNGAEKVAAGYFHSLAASGYGMAWGWGDNYSRQLGYFSYPYSQLAPIKIPIQGAYGYALPYEQNLWNDTEEGGLIKNSNNCYSYAINRRLGNPPNGKPQPGDWSGVRYDYYCRNENITVSEGIIAACQNDADALNGFFYEWVPGSILPPDHYVVALYIEDEDWTMSFDYHWYRPDEGAKTWSHKPGENDVTQLDARDEIITNPEEAYKNYGSPNYKVPVGYFVVGGNYIGKDSSEHSYVTENYSVIRNSVLIYEEYMPLNKNDLLQAFIDIGIQRGDELSTVFNILGKAPDVGSGIYVYLYRCTDGSYAIINSIDGSTIVNARLISEGTNVDLMESSD